MMYLSLSQKALSHNRAAQWIAAMVLFLLCVPTFAGDKKSEKAYRKQCKKEIKHLQAEGWKVYASPQSLEDALMPYYMELADGAKHICVQQEAGNVNLALSKAKLIAQKSYAEDIESIIKAEIVNEMKNVDTGDDVQSEERFQAIFKQKVDQRISGFAPRCTLTRNNKNGHVEVMQYYTYKLKV